MDRIRAVNAVKVLRLKVGDRWVEVTLQAESSSGEESPESRRQSEKAMAQIERYLQTRSDIQSTIKPGSTRRPPRGAGAFESSHSDTAERCEELLDELGFGT